MSTQKLVNLLEEKGERVTKTREKILDILISDSPVTVNEIQQKLKNTNKTTVYRFLDNLVKLGLIKQLYLESSSIYYEIVHDHHHHVVCRSCNKITPLASKSLEKYINSLQKKIKKGMKYNKVEHSLEFFGLCSNCS